MQTVTPKATLTLIIALLVLPVSGAQDAPTVLKGTWTANAGARVLGGTWSAQVEAGTPNGAHGRWAILDGNQRIVMQGTWSAQKRAKVWQGTWSAVVVSQVGGRSVSSPPYSGSWQADVDPSQTGTLLEMLKRTAEASVSGTWQSAQQQGKWTVKALPE